MDPTISGEQDGGRDAVGGCGAPASGDERLDLIEHPVGVTGEPHVVVPVELHQARVRDAVGDMLCVLGDDMAVPAPVQDEGGRLDAFEHGPKVGV